MAVIQRAWSQLFAFPLVPRPTITYRTGELIDIAFCKAVSASPVGTRTAEIARKSDLTFSMPTERVRNRQELETFDHSCVTSFLGEVARLHGKPQALRSTEVSENVKLPLSGVEIMGMIESSMSRENMERIFVVLSSLSNESMADVPAAFFNILRSFSV